MINPDISFILQNLPHLMSGGGAPMQMGMAPNPQDKAMIAPSSLNGSGSLLPINMPKNKKKEEQEEMPMYGGLLSQMMGSS